MDNSSGLLLDHLSGRYGPTPFPYASPFSFFHEMTTVEFSPLIELDPSNGLSTFLRDSIDTTGDGSVTESNGELLVASGATAGSTATLRTKERGRYQPGIEGMAGHAVRLPVMPTGDQDAWWEYGDGIDGARVGVDGTGKYVQFIHHGTVDDKVYQADWNLDRLDGSEDDGNRSGLTLDPTHCTIWRTRFTHYGAGPALIEAYILSPDGMPYLVPVHFFGSESGEIFWENPKLPLRQSVDNGTTGGNLELYVGGRHFAVLGRYNPNRRRTPGFADSRNVDSGVWTPICSFRKKSDRKWRARSIKVSDMGVLAGDDADMAVVLGGTLTGASWGTPELVDPDETSLEFDESATAITGGTAMAGFLVSGGQGSNTDESGVQGLGTDIPDDTVITIVVRGRGANTTAGAVFVMEEEA